MPRRHRRSGAHERPYAASRGRSARIASLQEQVKVAESQIAIPLLIRADLIGVFSIESPVRYTFSEHDRGLVSIVANQIASAINNAAAKRFTRSARG